MNRLSKTILPLALGLGLTSVVELPANAFPRKSHRHNRSRVIIVSPSRDRYDDDYYYDDYGRDIDYGRRDRYDDDYYYGRRRRRRSSRYDCGPRNRRVGRRRRRRRYYSDSPVYRNYPSNDRSVRVIRY